MTFLRKSPLAAGTFLALLLPVLTTGEASAREEVLRWTHPEPEAVDRFEIHWGLASRLYTNTIDAGMPTPVDGVYSHTIQVTPDESIVYFALTAVGDGLASDFSNERSRDENGNPAVIGEGAWGSVVSGTETFSVKKLGKTKLTTDWTLAFGTGSSAAFTAQDESGQTYTGSFVTKGKKGQKLTLTLDAISRTNLAGVLNAALQQIEGAPADATITVETAELKGKLKQAGTQLSLKGKLKLLMSSPTEGERKGRLKFKHQGAVVVVQ